MFTALAKDQEVDRDQLTAGKPVPARTIRVRQVLNGTGTPAQAAQAAEQLHAAGYTVTGTRNAPERTAATAVAYPPGLERHAAAMAARLKTPATPQADPNAAPDMVTLAVDPATPACEADSPASPKGDTRCHSDETQ